MVAKAKEWLARAPKKLDPEQAKLLRDVLERPDDDGARQVYADWLMERNDPRGELILLQIQLAKDPKSANAAQRASQLYDENYERWLEEIGWPEKSLGRPRMRKGFLEKVDVLAQVLAPILENLFAREPVRALRIRSVKPASLLDDILSHPEMKRVEEIDFWGANSFSAAQAKKIASSPNLSGLRRLSLFATALGPKGVKAFFDALALPKLEHLHLGDCKLGDDGAAAVAAAKSLPRILDLAHNRIGASGVEALAASPALAGVETLVLSSNAIGDEGAAALAASPHTRALRTLRLGNAELGEKGAKALAASKTLQKLEALDVGNTRIGAAGAKALESLPALKRLDVSDCDGATTRLPAPPRYGSWSFHGEGMLEDDPAA